MKTIEEKIREFAGKLTPCGICNRKECRVEIEGCAWYKDIYKALSEVAKLQREIDEEVRLKKCDDMTKAEYDREVAFADWCNKNGKGTPTYSDAIEWARKEVINKVCEWLKARNVLTEVSIEGFKKAMEELV